MELGGNCDRTYWKDGGEACCIAGYEGGTEESSSSASTSGDQYVIFKIEKNE